MGGDGFGLARPVAACAEPAAVTIGMIVLIVFRDTPAFAKSVTDVYGLPAMIRLAMAGPTPGSD